MTIYCNISITINSTFDVRACHEVDKQVVLEWVSQSQYITNNHGQEWLCREVSEVGARVIRYCVIPQNR